MKRILFHPDLVDREFGSHLVSVPKLIAWASKQGLDMVTQPPVKAYQFAQVEALLCAIERAARESTPEPMAEAVLKATPHLANDRAAEIAPSWLVGADAHEQWRRMLKGAIEGGELILLHFGSKLPVGGIEPVKPPSKRQATDEGWKAKAQLQAAQIIARDRARDLYPSQINIADEIARAFRRDGITGSDGKPLTGDTIKRHALNGISSAVGKRQSTQIARGK